MSEKITALLEAIVSKKPADAREVFDSIMVEKLRDTVQSHRDVVAENLFNNHEADEELDEDYEDEGEVLEEGRKGPVDKHGVVELKTFIDNEYGLQNHRQAIHRNQMNHAEKGRHDREKAVVGWKHHADLGANKYAETFGGLGQKGHHIFNNATRHAVAKELEAEHYEDHIKPLLASKR